jgi:enolase
MKIVSIKAIQILDSRGNPTIRTFIKLDDGSIHSSSVPSGASTGKYEAVELRDNDPKKFLGQSVEKAVANVNDVIAKGIIVMDINDPEKIDRKMIEMDGTENKSKLGANAILSVSQAAMKAAAHINRQPLWKFINQYYSFKEVSAGTSPRLMVNVINGGKHANWNFDIQEFMISPLTNKPSEAVKMASEIFHTLGKKLKEMNLSTLVGDEGGYSPSLEGNEQALTIIIEAARELNYRNGIDYGLALDSAASEFFVDDKYVFKKNNQQLTGKELADYYLKLRERFQIFSFEDPFAQDDWNDFAKFTGELKFAPTLIIGDDLYTTNVKRIKQGDDCKATNAVLIKPNQIGTIYETVQAIKLAQQVGWKVVVSHRSGETEDSFISDLAYGAVADFIKTGSMSRSERLAKYNRLIEIENGL